MAKNFKDIIEIEISTVVHVLVTVATSAIFAYWWLMPTLLYGLLWWRNNQAAFIYTELLCIYGYSLAIYIPISVRGCFFYLC